MAVSPKKDSGFVLKDCALIAIATGQRAITLKEFRDLLATITSGSIDYHFWGGMLQPRFEEREFNNDFASWARHSLHDGILAERLAMIDPADYQNMEPLRLELLEQVEQRLDESEYLHWAHALYPFEFIHAKIVVFDTHHRLKAPRRLASMLPRMSTSSVFYHFIDARRRLGGKDDFRQWLESFGDSYLPLCAELAAIDPSFAPLTELRQQLAETFSRHFKGARS
ncbi:MAG TPA: DUF5752 family protein [Nitrosomonas halophila]|nr:DUF5752 family protein [Nitrosomonas halophila]